MKQRWEYLGRASQDTHKFFREWETGRIGVADLSGTYPHQTDDGVMYLDLDRKVKVCEDACFMLPLMRGREEVYTLITFKQLRWLAERWPELKLEVYE